MVRTSLTTSLATGGSDKEIVTYAGHRSASFTKDRYAHLFKEAGAKLADRLDALIESSRAAPAAPSARASGEPLA